MKRLPRALAVLLLLLLPACAGEPQTALEPLPSGYTLEDAKDGGCVVFEDGDITSGQKLWSSFVSAAGKGRAAAVRLAYYYTLGEPSHYSPEYYEEIKDDYPKLFFSDLTFDGGTYTIRDYSEDAPAVKEYPYLVKYEGAPESPTATFSKYTYYVLVHDDTVTWDRLERGLYSSTFGDYIDHRRVYSDLVFK